MPGDTLPDVPETTPLTKVLIANRGEIAVRVIRACKDAGIGSVAVYAEPDRDAMFVRIADEAHSLGGTTPADSYLDIDKLLTIAADSGADSVHPGYGFLAENADFAQAVIDAGLIWIGPPPSAIENLGDKVKARHIAEKVGAPLAPGTKNPLQNAEEAVAFAEENGLPIAIKAAFGGGGRGLKVAREMSEVADAFESAVREAVSAFGRGECFVEKFLDQPRHVETQCLADQHGNVVVVSTRDCSLQRRHQKVVEEAPAPAITPELRAHIGGICAAAMSKINYIGAGTVEFLYEDGEFYFIEMNTRLQVEHPVTEMVTGIDLVREQIRIAAGLPLSFRQEDVVFDGHAIECRINAENPKTFTPSPGLVTDFHAPGGLGVRMDSALYAGYSIPPYYDSLIGKLIVHGRDREECLARLCRCLGEIVVAGIDTNIPLFQELMSQPDIIAGDYDIHWLERWMKSQAALAAA